MVPATVPLMKVFCLRVGATFRAQGSYTENPPENAIFPPAALRVSAVASGYTENSSFPYTLEREAWKGYRAQQPQPWKVI